VKSVAVITVCDWGAAEVFGEALTAAGIPYEVKSIAPTAYVPSATPASFEVRVPEEHQHAATQVLADLEDEAEAAALREFGEAAPPEEPRPVRGALPRALSALLLGLFVVVLAVSIWLEVHDVALP
jgi:hypothetical protein